MKRATLSTGLRLSWLLACVPGLPGCADSFAIKNEAVSTEVQSQLQAQAVPASELNLVKGGLNVRSRSMPPPEGVLKVPMWAC